MDELALSFVRRDMLSGSSDSGRATIAYVQRMPSMFRVLALSVGCVGCVGSVAAGDGRPQAGDGIAHGDGRPGAAGAPAGGGAGNGTGPAVVPPVGSGPAAAGPPPPAGCAAIAPGPSIMRRLTTDEFAHLLRDLVGAAAPAPAGIDLPAENYQEGYDGYGEAQAFTSAHLRAFRAAAQSVVRALSADTATRDKVVGCGLSGSSAGACLSSFITKFGRRAFRRPLTPDEVSAYTALANQPAVATTTTPGALAVIEAMLTSPSFLFVVDTGTPDPANPGVVRLDGYALATRLSFMMWGTGPDDALLDAARDGVLDRRDGLVSTVRRLLSDARAADGTWAFARRWLRVEQLGHVQLDAQQSAALTPELQASMVEETRRLVAAATAPGARLSTLLTAPQSGLDARLARHYGIARPTGARDWEPMDLRPYHRGSGLLTQGTFLVSTAKTRVDTPIKRAVYLRDALICRPPPPPPAVVPSIDAVNVPKSSPLPTLLGNHRSAPVCAGCHTLLDPLGFGLESFGRLAEWRTADEFGNPIDGHGQIAESTPPDFTGAPELGTRLAALPAFAGCNARQLFRYGAGRHESDTEACALDALGASVAAGDGSYGSLVEALATSDLLRYARKGE